MPFGKFIFWFCERTSNGTALKQVKNNNQQQSKCANQTHTKQWVKRL